MTNLDERIEKAIGDCVGVMAVSPQWDLNGVIQTLTDLQAALTWKPTKEENPPVMGYYYVTLNRKSGIRFPDGSIRGAAYWSGTGWSHPVEAWMELPQPYTPTEAKDEHK